MRSFGSKRKGEKGRRRSPSPPMYIAGISASAIVVAPSSCAENCKRLWRARCMRDEPVTFAERQEGDSIDKECEKSEKNRLDGEDAQVSS